MQTATHAPPFQHGQSSHQQPGQQERQGQQQHPQLQQQPHQVQQQQQQQQQGQPQHRQRALAGDPASDPTYLRRVSAALRKQLSRPVTRLVHNPVFTGPQAGVEQPSTSLPTQSFADAPQQQQQQWQQQWQHQQQRQQQAPAHTVITVLPASTSPFPGAAGAPLLQGAKQMGMAPLQPPAAGGASPQQQQQQRHFPDSVQSGSDQNRPHQGWGGQGSSAEPGTRSGPYVGYASGTWLEVEMRSEVDDLAHCVDKYATRRYQKRLERDKATMDEQMAEMKRRFSDQQARITEMELMMPGEDGQYRLLKRELKDMEEDCDFYYQRYLDEKKQRESAQETIAAALAHLEGIEAEFARIKQLVEEPAALLDAALAEERARAAAALAAAQHQQVLPVVPEMVLAAEKVVGRPKKRWPDVRKMCTRLALVLVLLGCIAASISSTWYLTKTYQCV